MSTQVFETIQALVERYGEARYSAAVAGECGGPDDVAEADREAAELLDKIMKRFREIGDSDGLVRRAYERGRDDEAADDDHPDVDRHGGWLGWLLNLEATS